MNVSQNQLLTKDWDIWNNLGKFVLLKIFLN